MSVYDNWSPLQPDKRKVPSQWMLTLVLMALVYMYVVGWALATAVVEVGLTDLTP